MEELLVDNIKIERLGDLLLNAATLPVSESPNITFSTQSATFDVSVPDGTTATVVLTGLQSAVTKQETIVFNGSSPSTKLSVNYFDGISTVATLGGSASTLTIQNRTRSGQPLLTLATTSSTSKARFSSVRRSRLFTEGGITGDLDKKVCFSLLGKGIIKFKDIVTDLSTLEQYTVLDVNDISDSFGYHHTEIFLGRLR